MAVTRADIVSNIRNVLSISGKDSARLLEAMLESVIETMMDGRPVTIPGLGRFYVRDTPPRHGRNPKTGVYVAVPGRRKAFFTMSRVFRLKMLSYFQALEAGAETEDGPESGAFPDGTDAFPSGPAGRAEGPPAPR